MSRAFPRFHRTNPPLPAVGVGVGVVLYRIIGKIEGQLTISGLHFFAANPNPTQAQLTTLLGVLDGGLFNPYAGMISADWLATLSSLTVVHRNDIMGVQRFGIASFPGTRPAGHEPTEVTAWFNKSTAVKGQHGRGRVSIPALSTADVTGSSVGSVAWNLSAAAYVTAALANYSDGTFVWNACVAQRSSAPPHLVTNAGLMTSIAATNRLTGTVRRRKIGRGK